MWLNQQRISQVLDFLNQQEPVIQNSSLIAQNEWGSLKVEERVDLLKKFVADFLSKEKQIIEEITRQMGRPISQAISELKGFKERADYMLSIAEDKLQNIYLPEKENFKNYIKRIPMGVSFVIAPWNYPYLTSVNSIIPSLASGNSVILKHSAQTPLCAEQLYESAKKTLPKNVFSFLSFKSGRKKGDKSWLQEVRRRKF